MLRFLRTDIYVILEYSKILNTLFIGTCLLIYLVVITHLACIIKPPYQNMRRDVPGNLYLQK